MNMRKTFRRIVRSSLLARHIKRIIVNRMELSKRKPLIKPVKMSKDEYIAIKANFSSIENVINSMILELKNGCNTIMMPKRTIFGNDTVKVLSEHGDYLGPVIEYKGNIYKCIKKDALDDFKKLYSTGVLQAFGQLGFIPKIEIEDYTINDYALLLKCEKLDLTKYNSVSLEQSAKMLCFVSFLQQVCRANNVVLRDPHCYNYCMTESGKMVYFDIGSFYFIKDNEYYDDFSMVTLGAYRLLFGYFPESVLYYREIDEFRPGISNYFFPDNFREFRYYKRRFLLYHFFHSNFFAYTAACRVFNNYICKPEDIQILFCNKDCDVDKILISSTKRSNINGVSCETINY